MVRLKMSAAADWNIYGEFVVTKILEGEYASADAAWFSPNELVFIRRATDKEYEAAMRLSECFDR